MEPRLVITIAIAVTLAVTGAFWAALSEHRNRRWHEQAGVELTLLKEQMVTILRDHGRWIEAELEHGSSKSMKARLQELEEQLEEMRNGPRP